MSPNTNDSQLDVYRVHHESRTTFDSIIAVPAGTPLERVEQALGERIRDESVDGRFRLYDDGLAVTIIDSPGDLAQVYVNQEFSREELDA
ncbi:hypothetical protein MUG78_17340 [Gordonia alkaliphila]|uniref:hypothetical protein n=1 Tax=Gordonia alkaliphila TaxID=1053547 RepID=UPI001FF2C9B0|nr:hypothetical protein [Gordonia alkaliphila]MCK0441166.1 hypothetical protein [Gordonia alkaliphila]